MKTNKLHIKKGDIVKVIAGDDKGKQGKILEVDPEKNRAIVEGIALVAKHTRPNAQNPKGGILKKEAPVHASNLMVIDNSGKPTRTGHKVDEKSGKKVRISKNTGEVIK